MTAALITAVAWTLAVVAVLVAWPWLLAVRPGRWTAPVPGPSRDDLRVAWRAGAPVRPGTLLAWWALVLMASLLPAASGSLAADLDAGLLWVLVLALIGWLSRPSSSLSHSAVVGGVITLTAVVLPVVMRAATLNLSDLVVAQQGGAGNWFVVREPFLVLSAGICLVSLAALWKDAEQAAVSDPWSLVLAWGRPLVGAHLVVVLYLGGWWAFVPFLDGLPWLNTAIKTLVVLAGLSWLRRRRWATPDLLCGWLPALTLVVGLASLAWLIVGGAVR
jgi:hypothetical protein